MADTQPRHSGHDAIIQVPNGNEIQVTNVSWDRDVNSTEVQYNGNLRADNVITGLRFSGSFEYDGANEDLRERMWHNGDQFHEEGEPVRFKMVVKETASESGQDGFPRTFLFEECIITSESRDIPGDDVASTTWDFVAKDMYKTTS